MIDTATESITLRRFRRGDDAAIVRYANNPRIYRATVAMPYPYVRKHAREWIEMCRQEMTRTRPGLMSFAIDFQGEAIGCVGLSDIEGHKAAIGYWLAEPYWGRGIMTRSVRMTTEFGFDEVGLVRLYAHIFPFNTASARVLEKNGYEVEGRMRKETEKDGSFHDMILYSAVR